MKEDDLPYLDRLDVDLSILTPEQRLYRDTGYFIYRGLIPDDLIDAYLFVHGPDKNERGYVTSKELKDICLYKPLYDLLKDFVGDDLGLIACFQGDTPTSCLWHQDEMYNPRNITSWGIGVFINLESINESAAMEFVPGSHKSVLGNADPKEQDAIFREIIKKNKLPVKQWEGKKGDVLIWHRDLIHRETKNKIIPSKRRALIAQYTACSVVTDISVAQHTESDGRYFIHGPICD